MALCLAFAAARPGQAGQRAEAAQMIPPAQALPMVQAGPAVRATPASSAKDQLVFGMSAAFSGPARSLGIEYYRGLMAAFELVNAQGGAGGHRLALLLRDDGYSPSGAMRNTIAFVEQDRVFALLGYVGTPTTARVLPLIRHYGPSSVSLLFPLTGADLVREPNCTNCVYTLRASYLDETHALVQALVNAGKKRIAVFHQADVYGRTGWDGVRRALAARKLSIVAEATYGRSANFRSDFRREAALIIAGAPDAVVTVGTAPASAAFIRDLRDQGFAGMVCTLSFADADNIVKRLVALGQGTGRDYLHGLVFSQVVPSYEDTSIPAVRSYREAMARTQAVLPEQLPRVDYVPHRLGFVSFEGFLAGMALAEAVRRTSAEPTRDDLRRAFAGLSSVDLGLGEKTDLRPGPMQGLRRTYLTLYRDGRFVGVDDLSGALK